MLTKGSGHLLGRKRAAADPALAALSGSNFHHALTELHRIDPGAWAAAFRPSSASETRNPERQTHNEPELHTNPQCRWLQYSLDSESLSLNRSAQLHSITETWSSSESQEDINISL
ncbi:hypothetical protein MHYP_G00260730 [Metynnis hypsauchen]